ncbi:MAG: c-type cytochrome [Bryobacterales bacterium]|nr:c-type cytochrome [Bryobacterales bacterium]
MKKMYGSGRAAAFALSSCLLVFHGCSRSKPPYSPEQALKMFHVPEGFHVELVASEPLISDAIAMSFDEHGRIWVVEMADYPLDPKSLGRIRLLEDRDGDGRFERATVFADGLHFPEGVMPWKKGILVTCAPDILYFEDTDGDGRADMRRVVLTGFAQGNPQLRVNSPLYGLDNWIYVSYPRPPVPHRYVKEFGDQGSAIRFPDHPEIPALNIHGMDVRFRMDPPQVEALAGNSQFGNAMDAWGRRYTVWNNDHIREVVIQNRYLKRNPYLAAPTAMQSLSDHGKAAAVYPKTVDPFYIHDSQTGHFTSACGISVYGGGRFPKDFDLNSFTCEPVHGLVHRDVLVENGATFRAKRADEKSEFITSSDAWFRPVFTTVGPDGALYVVDYYRYTVEHPEFVPPHLLKQIDFEAHRRLGRIYRVVYGDPKPVKVTLAQASPAELVTALSDGNMWRRVTAQRLLIDQQDRTVQSELEKLAREGEPAVARVHALWTLQGMNALADEAILRALDDSTAGVRENAVRLAELRLPNRALEEKLLRLAGDSSARVRFQLACTLGLLPPKRAFPALKSIALRDAGDSWFQTAVLTSAADDAVMWYREMTASKADDSFLRRIGSVVGARGKDVEIREVLGVVANARQAGDAGWRVATLEGVADGLRHQSGGRTPLHISQEIVVGLLHEPPLAIQSAALQVAGAVRMSPTPAFAALLRRARATAADERAPEASRKMAIGTLGLDMSPEVVPVLAALLDPKRSETVQIAAAGALTANADPAVGAAFIAHWREATGNVRERMLAWYFGDKSRLPALLGAVEARTVQPWSLGPARTQQLLRSKDPAIAARANSLLGEASQAQRKAVYDRYVPALAMKEDAQRGRAVYERACSECHKIGNTGSEVGPDLRTVSTHYKEALLADILMPNLNIEGGYEEYLVETADGQTITGILARETPVSMTLRRRKGEEDTILRSAVKSMRSLNVSPMPDDLENSIDVQQMADVIAYVKSLK